jgi:hypothetical protein
MSGGYDSRGVAAFLHELGERERTIAVTYHHGPQLEAMDSPVAARVAEFLGVQHRTIEFYNGDLRRVVEMNSRLGQGMKLCKETDFWDCVGTEVYGPSEGVLFVGDTPFGMKKRRSRGEKEDVLGLINIYPTDGIAWFLNMLPSESAEDLRESWHDNLIQLRARVPACEDERDAQAYMYLDQRVSNFLMLWRECFQMSYLRVVNPFLDNDILDFARTIPGELREGKSLYKEALASAFPELYRLPMASGGFGLSNFNSEISEQLPALGDTLEDRPSKLDDLVPPEVILRLLELVGSPGAKGTERIKGLGSSAPKHFPLARRFLRFFESNVRRATTHHVSKSELALRIFFIREFLAPSAARSQCPRPTPHTVAQLR